MNSVICPFNNWAQDYKWFLCCINVPVVQLVSSNTSGSPAVSCVDTLFYSTDLKRLCQQQFFKLLDFVSKRTYYNRQTDRQTDTFDQWPFKNPFFRQPESLWGQFAFKYRSNCICIAITTQRFYIFWYMFTMIANRKHLLLYNVLRKTSKQTSGVN